MKKRIAIVCFKYPPKYSGYGKQLKSVISNINDDSLEFNILTAYDISNSECSKNINIISLCNNADENQNKVFYEFCFRCLKWLILNKDRYDIIHCIKSGPEAIVCNIVSKIFNKPLIIKVVQQELSNREIDDAKGIKKNIRKLRNLLLKNTDNFIAISQEIEDNIKDKVCSKTNILRIPNGVDTDNKFIMPTPSEKRATREKLNLPIDEVIILYAGAINKRKGILDLIESMDYINNNTKISLVMCGPILEPIDIEGIVSLHNKKNNNVSMIYRGVITNVNEYMMASDIFILASYSEGLPNVLLEAASTGLALIATDIGGSRDIVINNRTGLLVPTGSPKEIAKSIMELADNIELRNEMGMNARIRMENKYSIKEVSKQYVQLYNNLIINA